MSDRRKYRLYIPIIMNKTSLYKRPFAVALVIVLSFASFAIGGCSEPARTITESTVYENRLQVDNLSLGYPSDMHEASDESENGPIPFANTVLGGALTASSKAISKEGVTYILSATEKDTDRTLSDVEDNYKILESTLNVTNEAGFTRLALSKEKVVVNGLECMIVDTTISAPEQLGGSAGRGIIYVLADDGGKIVGQVEGYFYGDDYDQDPALYDSIFASVQLDK